MFVPVVNVIVQPVTNADRPGIEKTHRKQRYPAYMVPLIKAKWGPKAKVVVEQLPEDVDRHWQLPLQPNMAPEESELIRCKNYVRESKRDVFHEVYRDEEFREIVRAALVEENPFRIAKEKDEEEIRARASKTAAKALIDAAADGEVQAERKAAKSRPGRRRQLAQV